LKGSLFDEQSIGRSCKGEYVNSQKFISTADAMEGIKDIIRDVFKQVMESELEDRLGYEHYILSIR